METDRKFAGLVLLPPNVEIPSSLAKVLCFCVLLLLFFLGCWIAEMMVLLSAEMLPSIFLWAAAPTTCLEDSAFWETALLNAAIPVYQAWFSFPARMGIFSALSSLPPGSWCLCCAVGLPGCRSFCLLSLLTLHSSCEPCYCISRFPLLLSVLPPFYDFQCWLPLLGV